MKLPKFLNRSVAVRTTILVLGIVTIIMLVAGLWQTQYTSGVVAREIHRQAGRSMDGAIKVIDNRVSNVEAAVVTAANYAYLLAPHEDQTFTLLRRLLEANKDISAVTLMYRADYFPQHGRYYAPTISRNGEHFVEEEIGGPEHDFCYLETDSNWVYTNKYDRGYWCLPYLDSMSTRRAMVSYSVPLHDSKGDIYAILCADIDLNWVRQIVESAKPYDCSEVMVIARDSQFICHPEERWVKSVNAIEEIKKSRNEKMIALASRMMRWERGVDTVDALSLLFDDDNKSQGKSLVFYAPVSRVQWSVCFSVPESKVMEQPNALRTHMIVLLIILLIAIAIVLRFVIHAQLWPLKSLASSASSVARGDFHTALPHISTHDEIRELRDSFENMQHSLIGYIKKLQKTTASKAVIENELRVATDIQMSMLPKDFDIRHLLPDVEPPFSIYGRVKPAKAVGGDLFDFKVRDNRLFFCIGDVSGKGVPAALVMAVTLSLFHTVSANEDSPERIVTLLNNTMSVENDSNMFVTLFVGILDLNTNHLLYCNAGHDAPLILDDRGINPLPCDSNLPCGVMEGWQFSLQQTDIARGASIFLYTDGLTEAENTDHEQFGEDRIIEVAARGLRDPQPLIDNMTAAVRDFVGTAEQSDDLTMLCIKLVES